MTEDQLARTHKKYDVKQLIVAINLIWILGAMISCQSEVPAVVKPDQLNFTINGKTVPSGYVGIPDPENEDVYQTKVGDTIRLLDDNIDIAYKRTWIIGDKVHPSTSAVCRPYLAAGLHKIQLCEGGNVNCVFKYIHVSGPTTSDVTYASANSDAEERMDQGTTSIEPEVTHKEKEPQASKVSTDETAKPEPPKNIEPVPEKKPKETSKPPERKHTIADYNSPGAKVGLAGSNYNSSCAEWVESGKITFKVKKALVIDEAWVYGDSQGRMAVTLSDDQGGKESTQKLVLAGRTQLKFIDLEPELFPGRTYTLSFYSKEENGNKAKLGNIKSCVSIPRQASNRDIEIIYGADCLLFDLKYLVL